MAIGDLAAMIEIQLQEGPRKMLDALIAHREELDRGELADAAGFSRTSSGVGAHLKVLRDNSLATVEGGVISPTELVIDG